MNIQISVMVWTVLCFSLFMIVLNNLLFKPILTLMDERKEKIKNSSAKILKTESETDGCNDSSTALQMNAFNESDARLEEFAIYFAERFIKQ